MEDEATICDAQKLGEDQEIRLMSVSHQGAIANGSPRATEAYVVFSLLSHRCKRRFVERNERVCTLVGTVGRFVSMKSEKVSGYVIKLFYVTRASVVVESWDRAMSNDNGQHATMGMPWVRSWSIF